MRTYWIIGLALVASGGLLLAMITGIEPKPLLKIKPNSFQRHEEIGAVVYRRLRQEARESDVLILGSAPWVADYQKVWRGFLLAGQDDGLQARPFFEQEGLTSAAIKKPGFDQPSKVDLLGGGAADVSEPRFLGHFLFQQSSHFFDKSVAQILVNKQKSYLAITILPFVVAKHQLDRLYPGCDPDEIPSGSLNQMGCAARRASQTYLRKKLDPKKIWAVLEQHGQRDLLLFVYQPSD